MEVSQSHPVMKAFCGLLLDMMVQGGPAGKKLRDAEEGRYPEPQTHQTVYTYMQFNFTYNLNALPDHLRSPQTTMANRIRVSRVHSGQFVLLRTRLRITGLKCMK